MLEDLAYAYAETSEIGGTAIYYLLLVLGGLIGGFTNRAESRLLRAPYFALTAVTLLCGTLISLLMVPFLVSAMTAGMLWIIVGIEFGALIGVGFWIARLAMARSRDAYGVADRAFLAFIPIANLWLLFTPSHHPESGTDRSSAPLLSGAAGVMVGIVLMLADRGLAQFTSTASARTVEAASLRGDLGGAVILRSLDQIVANTTVPVQVDAVTTLKRLEAEAPYLRFHYEVTAGAPITLDAAFIARSIGRICEADIRLIRAGVVIEHRYLWTDGSEIVRFSADEKDCTV